MNDSTIEKILSAMTPELVSAFRLAIEIGKWPDGRKLTPEQRETCLQAVIAWELRNLPEEERTGYINKAEKEGEVCDNPSHSHEESEAMVKFLH
ncbi:MAG: YeaC family protein [Moraxellaceae bacterium]